ncbi:MAG: hypothetical protein V3T76_01725, partial [candidate division NC10 bacterium]
MGYKSNILYSSPRVALRPFRSLGSLRSLRSDRADGQIVRRVKRARRRPRGDGQEVVAVGRQAGGGKV